MSGHDVRVLQQYLSFSGFPTSVDGSFGPSTKVHVVGFEHRYRLPVNGVVNSPFVTKIRAMVADRKGTAAVASSTGGASFAPPPNVPTGGPGTPGAPGTTPGTPTTPPTGPPTTTPGAKATLVGGQAVAPADAPTAVKNVIAAANSIATTPYVWGGGHGSFNSSGYDCSGSVSYALHGGGLLSSPEVSGGFETYGSPGAGQWITLWANGGHVYMNIAGLWFDTAAQGSGNGNSRWSASRVVSPSGYVEVHPNGY